MSAFPSLLKRLTSIGLWGGASAFFGLLIGMGNLPLGFFILASLLLLLAILSGPQFIAALWLMGSPTLFIPINQALKALPFITVDRALFGVLAGMLFLNVTFDKVRRNQLLPVERVILVFIGYALVSLLASTNSVSLRQDLWFFLQYAVPMLTFILSRRIEWTDRGLQYLLGGLTLMGVLLAVMGLLQGLFGIGIFTAEYKEVTSGHVGRAYGTFSNAHTYIATLFVLLTLTILQYGIYRDSLVRFALLLAMGTMGIAILLGQTRAPWGGAALALFIILVRDRTVRPLLVTGSILAIIAGSVVFFLIIDQLDVFLHRVTNLATMDGRLATWATAVNMIAHNPLFGIGFGADSFLLNKTDYITGVGDLTQQHAVYLTTTHNEYLNVAVLLGIPGLVLFLYITVGLVRMMLRIHAAEAGSSVRRRFGLYVAATFIGIMFSSLLSNTFRQEYIWLLNYFLAGLVAGLPLDIWPTGDDQVREKLESPG